MARLIPFRDALADPQIRAGAFSGAAIALIAVVVLIALPLGLRGEGTRGGVQDNAQVLDANQETLMELAGVAAELEDTQQAIASQARDGRQRIRREIAELQEAIDQLASELERRGLIQQTGGTDHATPTPALSSSPSSGRADDTLGPSRPRDDDRGPAGGGGSSGPPPPGTAPDPPSDQPQPSAPLIDTSTVCGIALVPALCPSPVRR